MYTAEITFNDSHLYEVLKAENPVPRERSTLTISKKSISITAKDITAFKATVYGVIKICETYEKASSVIKNDN